MSLLALSDSSKHVIQILQLLDERRLCVSLSINQRELVLVSGLGLLWQHVGVKRDSKIAQESHKLLCTIVDLLKSDSLPVASEFGMLANALVARNGEKRGLSSGSKSGAVQGMLPPSQKQLKSSQSWKSHLAAANAVSDQQSSRPATVSGGSPPFALRDLESPSRSSKGHLPAENFSTPNLTGDQDGSLSDSPGQNSEPALYESGLPIGAGAGSGSGPLTTADWEYVVSDMDQGFSNIFTGIYGGKECGEDHGPFATIRAEYGQEPVDLPLGLGSTSQPSDLPELSPVAWSASSNGGEIGGKTGTTSAAQSVLNFSEDSMANADDGANGGFPGMLDPFQSIMMPPGGSVTGDFGTTGWDRRLAV